MRYVFNSDEVDDAQRDLIDRLQARGNVRFQDTADAEPGQKSQLLNNILSPLSFINDKDLDAFRTEDGGVTYAMGVLITPDDFYVGGEIDDFLEEE